MSKIDAKEKYFSKYIDSDKYDHAEDYLFSIIREAYSAGWSAAENYHSINNIIYKNRRKIIGSIKKVKRS